MANKSGSYDGVAFEIDNRWQFYVPELDRRFDSYELMKIGIDNAAKALVAVKREKLSLPMIDADGDEAVLTGLHAGHGHFITKPKRERRKGDRLFIRLPWIAAAFAEAKKLESREAAIRQILEQYAIEHTRYGFDSANHESEVARVKNEFTEKTKAAEKTDLEKEMAKIGGKPREVEW